MTIDNEAKWDEWFRTTAPEKYHDWLSKAPERAERRKRWEERIATNKPMTIEEFKAWLQKARKKLTQ